jgi:hypothetical protein
VTPTAATAQDVCRVAEDKQRYEEDLARDKVGQKKARHRPAGDNLPEEAEEERERTTYQCADYRHHLALRLGFSFWPYQARLILMTRTKKHGSKQQDLS